MELWLIITAIIMGVLSVFSILVLTGLVRPRQDGVDIVLEYLKKENTALVGKIERLEGIINTQSLEIKRQSEQINMLRTQIVLLETSHYDLPYPQWMFDFQGNLVSGNKAFEDTFLITKGKNLAQSMGATPFDFMDTEAATVYLENHRWVLSQKRPWEGALTIELNGKKQWLDMLLYPAYSGKRVVGVSGLIIPAKRTENY